MFIQSGINKEFGFMAVTVETLDLSFEWDAAKSTFCNFRDANGKMYAKTYKACKTKIAKQFKVEMTNGSRHACNFMAALKEAKSAMVWAV